MIYFSRGGAEERRGATKMSAQGVRRVEIAAVPRNDKGDVCASARGGHLPVREIAAISVGHVTLPLVAAPRRET